MKSLYRFTVLLVMLGIVIAIFSIMYEEGNEQDIQQNIQSETNMDVIDNLISENMDMTGERDEIISKAMAVKMIALFLEDKNHILSRDREIDFMDSNETDWYDKYFNLAIVEGWFNVKGESLHPFEGLTYEEISLMAKYFNLNLEEDGIGIVDKEMEDEITYAQFVKLYNKIIGADWSGSGLSIESIYIFATPEISSELNFHEAATDIGILNFEGLNCDQYIDNEIEVLMKGSEIVYINRVVEKAAVLRNAYITLLNDTEISVYMGGVWRDFVTDNAIEFYEEGIGDLLIIDNTIDKIEFKTKHMNGVVKKITADKLVIDDDISLAMDEDTKVYKNIDFLRVGDISDVIVGYNTAQIVLDDNDKVAGIIIDKKVTLNNIRIALSTTDYTSLYHDNVMVSSENAFSIKLNNMEEVVFDSPFDIDTYELNEGDRITVTPIEESTLTIGSITRGANQNRFNPTYRGILEIEKTEQGFLVINEVDLESYLYSVVPSEMPSSYGLEALKVQAICARSYAYTQAMQNRYHDYGAHVDDSTSCQVYNNISETENAIQSVNETKGQVLKYNGNIIVANFFSTSCGVTADSGDVWTNGVTKEFPTDSLDYLSYKYQGEETELDYDLENNEDFISFIKNDTLTTYDKQFSWYRWHTTMTANQIESVINHTIQECYEKEPQLIKTLDESNMFRSRDIISIGKLEDLSIYGRGNSGIITELIIEGSNGVYKIASEYYIRKIVAPINYVTEEENVILTLNDGSTISNRQYMPSAFYYMEKSYDESGELVSVEFNGGGYGHGVGMSQNGVKGMVDLGYSYEEILMHYYEGTEIDEIY